MFYLSLGGQLMNLICKYLVQLKSPTYTKSNLVVNIKTLARTKAMHNAVHFL